MRIWIEANKGRKCDRKKNYNMRRKRKTEKDREEKRKQGEVVTENAGHGEKKERSEIKIPRKGRIKRERTQIER